MEVIPVGKDKFTLDKYKVFRNIIQVVLLEVQWKDDGAVNDSPSMLLIMKDQATNLVLTEFTLETLQGILSKVGYRVVKKK